MRFSRSLFSIALAALGAIALSGCMSRQDMRASDQLTGWLEAAMFIEKAGRPEVAATEALCRRLAMEMTPETWMALSAWREMRCDANKDAQA